MQVLCYFLLFLYKFPVSGDSAKGKSMEASPPIRLLLYPVFLKVGKAHHLPNHQNHLWEWRFLNSTPNIASIAQNLRLRNVHFKNHKLPFARSSLSISAPQKPHTYFWQNKYHKCSNKNFSSHGYPLLFLPGKCCEGFSSRECWQSPARWERTETRVADLGKSNRIPRWERKCWEKQAEGRIQAELRRGGRVMERKVAQQICSAY